MSAVHGAEEDTRTEDEFEAAARSEGWVPEEEYRGRGTWVDARTFVLRGENIRPLLRARNQAQAAEIATLKGQIDTQARTIAEQKQAVDAAMALARRADERGYKRALAELEAKRNAAIDEGDRTVALQAQEEIDAMKGERVDTPPPAVAATPPPSPNTGMHPEVQAFVDANPWFHTDEDLRESMMGNHRSIMREHPMMPMKEQLALSKSRVVAAFPARFGVAPAAEPPAGDDDEEEEIDTMPEPARRPTASRVLPSAGRQVPARDRNASPFMRIADDGERAEAREQFNKVKRGDPGMTEEEWVTLWTDPHGADPIELRRKRKA